MLHYAMWSEEDYVLMLLLQTDRYVQLLINNACVCHFFLRVGESAHYQWNVVFSALSQDHSFNQVSTPESILFSISRRRWPLLSPKKKKKRCVNADWMDRGWEECPDLLIKMCVKDTSNSLWWYPACLMLPAHRLYRLRSPFTFSIWFSREHFATMSTERPWQRCAVW